MTAVTPPARPRRGGTGSARTPAYGWFHTLFRSWIDQLDLGHCVPHQARHTLATNLLRNGANLSHVKRYLGQGCGGYGE